MREHELREQFVKARREALLAYRFSANSYTFGAVSKIDQAIAAIDRPTWIDEILAWQGDSDAK